MRTMTATTNVTTRRKSTGRTQTTMTSSRPRGRRVTANTAPSIWANSEEKVIGQHPHQSCMSSFPETLNPSPVRAGEPAIDTNQAEDTAESFDLWIEAGHAEKHYWRDLWRYRGVFYILAWRDVCVRFKL